MHNKTLSQLSAELQAGNVSSVELTEHFLGKVGPGLKNPIYGGQIEATDRAVVKLRVEPV